MIDMTNVKKTSKKHRQNYQQKTIIFIYSFFDDNEYGKKIQNEDLGTLSTVNSRTHGGGKQDENFWREAISTISLHEAPPFSLSLLFFIVISADEGWKGHHQDMILGPTLQLSEVQQAPTLTQDNNHHYTR